MKRASATYKLCPDCGQPLLPKGVTKRPNEYDHAQGCPRAPKKAIFVQTSGTLDLFKPELLKKRFTPKT